MISNHNMIERAFEEARQHKGNKRNAVRQFAIGRARDLLIAAGVVDPAIKDQVPTTKPNKAVEQPFFEISEDLVSRFTREIGGKPVEQLEAEAKAVRNVSVYASDLMHSPKFEVLEDVISQELGKLPVLALGLPGTPTTRQIFARIPQCRVGAYTLELCRAEVGPHQAIADKDQPLGDAYFIMHEPITDRGGLPDVFFLERDGHGLWLGCGWAGPGSRWDPGYRLVVALRKNEPVKTLNTLL